MSRKLRIIGILLVILISISCGTGAPPASPIPLTPVGQIEVANSHVRGSDTFPGCTNLPVAREYGVCFVSYAPNDPTALKKPTFDMVFARDEQTTIYELPPGTYQLQEWQTDSEINQDPLYSPCVKTYVRPLETIVIQAKTTIVFGTERTLPVPGEFVEGNTINPNCGGSWSEPGGTPTDTPIVTPDPTKIAYVGAFAGEWSTNWGDQICSVDGVTVYCEYTHDQGRIDATLSDDGRTMDGQWGEYPSYSPPWDGGRVTLRLSDDGNTIEGEWWYGQDDYGGDWTGTRK